MYHKTKEGNKILISDMDDSHLDNTIMYYIRRIKTLNDMYFGKQEENINTLLSGRSLQTISKTDIIYDIQKTHTTLSLYLTEGIIRSKDYSSQLQELYSRKEKTNIETNKLYISSKNINEDIDEDEDEDEDFNY